MIHVSISGGAGGLGGTADTSSIGLDAVDPIVLMQRVTEQALELVEPVEGVLGGL